MTYPRNKKQDSCGKQAQGGYTLLAILLLLTLLVSVISLSSFAVKYHNDNHGRYLVTRMRILKIKEALLGRLAHIQGGINVISCGGFISDYGEEPDNFDLLLSKPSGFHKWQYNNGYKFWAGYRGNRYLTPSTPSPGEEKENDGWGNEFEVTFDGDEINIISRGSDSDNDSGNETGYEYDITETFSWRRTLKVTLKNTTTDNDTLDVALIYPQDGLVKREWDNDNFLDNDGSSIIIDFNDMKVPVGMRKIVVTGSGFKVEKTVCIPPGKGSYKVRIDL